MHLQIGNNWMVTAAHCVYNIDEDDEVVSTKSLKTDQNLWWDMMLILRWKAGELHERVAACKLSLCHPWSPWSKQRQRSTQVEHWKDQVNKDKDKDREAPSLGDLWPRLNTKSIFSPQEIYQSQQSCCPWELFKWGERHCPVKTGWVQFMHSRHNL